MAGGLSHRAIHRNLIEPPKLLSASNISKALSLSGLHATRAWGKLYQHCGVSSVLQYPSVTFLPPPSPSTKVYNTDIYGDEELRLLFELALSLSLALPSCHYSTPWRHLY